MNTLVFQENNGSVLSAAPCFSISDALLQLSVVTAEEMVKAKIGFAIRLFNRDLPEDGSLPEELFEHNQALLEFFLSVQEEADEHMGSGKSPVFPLAVHCDANLCLIGGSNGEGEEAVKPHVVSVKPFVKLPPNHSFFVVPVIGTVLFPQFKGSKSPGVLRSKGRKGAFFVLLLLNPTNPDDLPPMIILQVVSPSIHVSTGVCVCFSRAHLCSDSTPAPLSEDDDHPANPRVFFGGLPDSLGRYRVLKMNESYSRYEMSVPPVFDAQGHRVLPAQYRTVIPNGTIVAIRGSMKM